MIEKEALMRICDETEDGIDRLNKIKAYLYSVSPEKLNPVDNVQWVPCDKVQANDYNPNSVARTEMKLLHTSIDHDGYTQPIVTIYDAKNDKYVIVDGFHRYFVGVNCEDIKERNGGLLPVVVIDKDINDRMASTVRHNRARGKHSIDGMSSIVFKMLSNGWTDEAICNELGMEPEEVLRLKHITGFSKLFENAEYKKAWKTRQMMFLEEKYREDPSRTAQDLNKLLEADNEEKYRVHK